MKRDENEAWTGQECPAYWSFGSRDFPDAVGEYHFRVETRHKDLSHFFSQVYH